MKIKSFMTYFKSGSWNISNILRIFLKYVKVKYFSVSPVRRTIDFRADWDLLKVSKTHRPLDLSRPPWCRCWRDRQNNDADDVDVERYQRTLFLWTSCVLSAIWPANICSPSYTQDFTADIYSVQF